MKKIIKIILVTLFAIVLILVIGGIIFLKTFDVNRFKPQIIAAGQNALGRSIDFSRADLKLSFRKGIQLRIVDILIGEHPDFGTDSFLTAKEAALSVSIKDLILKRQIRVLGIACNSPKLNIIRLKDGRINVQTFAIAASPRPAETSVQKSPSKDVSQAAMGLPALFINNIDINNGSFTYTDYPFGHKLSLIVDKVALKAKDFSLTDFFPITLQASFASSTQNIFAQGKGWINMNNLSFVLKDVKASAELSGLSMDDLRSFIPQLEDVPLPEGKSGSLSASLDLFEVGPQGLIGLRGRGTLTKGALKMKELTVPIAPIEAKFTLSESAITLDNASFGLGKGKVELSGAISDYLLEQDYFLKTALKSLDFNECLDQST